MGESCDIMSKKEVFAMKVLLINGSPDREGCTYTPLCPVENTLRAAGLHPELFHIGGGPPPGCSGRCR